MGFFRTILIILLIYFGLKIVMRLFAPFLVNYMSKKMQERFTGQDQQPNRDINRPKEGETVIDNMPPKQKTSDKKVGEYIDYEEID